VPVAATELFLPAAECLLPPLSRSRLPAIPEHLLRHRRRGHLPEGSQLDRAGFSAAPDLPCGLLPPGADRGRGRGTGWSRAVDGLDLPALSPDLGPVPHDRGDPVSLRLQPSRDPPRLPSRF